MNDSTKIICFLISINLLLTGAIWFLSRPRFLPLPQIFVQLPYQPANIIVNTASDLGPLQPIWLGFAQGGEEQGGMLGSTVSKMRALRPAYVRLDHIFDDDYYGVVSGSSGNLQFNWTKLDREVENILAMGAKPFFSLSYMPGVLAPSKIELPKNWNDWGNLVKAAVEHYSGRNGKNLSGVYYEVWNEPDLDLFGGWTRGGAKNYLTLYEYAARGAAMAANTNQFYLGGPATTGLYTAWMADLYNFTGSRGLRLDFLSWHRYSHNPEQYASDVMNLYNKLGGKPLPRLIISEWGPTPEKDTVYGSEYAAVYTFATVRQLMDQVSLATAFEVKDGPEQGSSGWGILTHEGEGLAPKPRYWAFSWLAEVRGQRLSLNGEGSHVRAWATKEGQDKVNVWLVNFGRGGQPEGVPVTINGLPDGQWRVSKETLFGASSRADTSVNNGVWQTNFELRQNQVGRVILERK